jgi:hypothetical protein
MGLESRALLSTLTVSNTNDSGSGSLPAAVAQANSDAGSDTIVFSSVFNTPQTITLNSTLALTDTATTTISGPGANLLDGNGAIVNASSTATVKAEENPEAASLVLTTTRDVVDQFDNLTSLREAVTYANSHPGPDPITFDASVFGNTRQTIVLTGGPLVLTDPATTTIIGPGANKLTISGGGKSRIFDIQGGSVALSGMTITGGMANWVGACLTQAARSRSTASSSAATAHWLAGWPTSARCR